MKQVFKFVKTSKFRPDMYDNEVFRVGESPSGSFFILKYVEIEDQYDIFPYQDYARTEFRLSNATPLVVHTAITNGTWRLLKSSYDD